jgi:hypothetical protein
VSRLAALVFVIGSASAVAAPGGRVVRVERSGAGHGVAPRLCEIRGDTGTCVGDEPKAGQTVVVLDERRVLAEVQIVEATPFVARCPSLWTVTTRMLRGSHTDHDGIGVIDPGVHPIRARVIDKDRMPVSPSGQPGEEVWRAVDRDGDGTADILITRYNCDPTSRPIVGGSTYCIDVWAKAGSRLVKTTQLNFSQCNI